MAKPENAVQLIGAFMQEFFGSLLMYFLLWPFGSFFGETWVGWLSHFFGVIMLDIASGGSQVNPSVTVAMWVYGNVTFIGAVVRIVGQILAGFAAFPLLRSLTPSYVQIGGPELASEVNVKTGMMYEGLLTFGLLLVVFFCITYIGDPAKRPIIAVAIRGLIVNGSVTGPAMNPMIAFSWAVYKDPSHWLTAEHVLVYWLAPTTGAVAAAFLWKFFTGIFHGHKAKTD